MAGRYELGIMLGVGGMGVVHRAHDRHADRAVALKLLKPSVTRDEESLGRFEREARTARGLEHPHIVRVLDHGVDGDHPFLVMELLEGETLTERMARRRGTFELTDVLELLAPVAHALGYAHGCGVVHRDVKPENIFLPFAGGAKLLDFGIAKMAGDLDGLTRSGTALGTPVYMAPEQIESARRAGPASDQYALAVVLFEALAGELPWLVGTPVELLKTKLTTPPRDLEALRPGLSPSVRTAVARALAITPKKRFASVGDFWDALMS